MIRNDLSPVLLEVNLSPACAGRTSYLQRNLEKMTGGLFSILTHKLRRSGNLLGKWLRKQVQEKTNLEKAIDEKKILEDEILKTSRGGNDEVEGLEIEVEKVIVGEKGGEMSKSKIEENNAGNNKKDDLGDMSKLKSENLGSEGRADAEELVKAEEKEKEKRQIWKEEFRQNLKTLEAHSLRFVNISESGHTRANIGHKNRLYNKPLIRKSSPEMLRETIYAFKSDPNLPSEGFFTKKAKDKNFMKMKPKAGIRDINVKDKFNDDSDGKFNINGRDRSKERENDVKTFEIVDASEIAPPRVSGWKLVTFETQPEEIQRMIGGQMDLVVFGNKIDIRREMKREERIRKDYYARVLQRFFHDISERRWLSRMQQNG